MWIKLIGLLSGVIALCGPWERSQQSPRVSGSAGNYWHSADSGHTETIQLHQNTLHMHAPHQMHADRADLTCTVGILPCKQNGLEAVPVGGIDAFKWHLTFKKTKNLSNTNLVLVRVSIEIRIQHISNIPDTARQNNDLLHP